MTWRFREIRNIPWMILILLLIACVTIPYAFADQPITRSKDLQLNVGNSLVIHSDQNSIQRIFLEGNLSSSRVTEPSKYPGNSLELASTNPGSYALRVLFDNPSDYRVNLFVEDSTSNFTNNTTYLSSSGPFELDINATFVPRPDNAPAAPPSAPPWDRLVNWVGKFGEAFPLWVKVLYLVLGFQFFSVGGLWIRRETARREPGAQRLDAGNKAYLWLDVAYRFLLVSFVTIVAIMGGELLILFVLRFMFLATLDLLSLWDLFVVGFAMGAVIIVYLFRFTLEKAFDLKPMENE